MRLYDGLGNDVTEDFVHVTELVNLRSQVCELEAKVKKLSKKKKKETE